MDYQNVYRSAREAFFTHAVDRHWCGQFDPQKLGQLLTSKRNRASVLQEVRVYRGLPGGTQDPQGYAASRKQIAAWNAMPNVTAITRPLRYPWGWPDNHAVGSKPGEKGIDVALAIDFAAMASRGQYDVGILFSGDTDLKPAIEFADAADVNVRRAPARPPTPPYLRCARDAST